MHSQSRRARIQNSNLTRLGPAIIGLALTAADERDDAVITTVELFFPEDVTIPVVAVAMPPGGVWGYTTSATGITWNGGTAEGDQSFAFTIGPLPAEPRRLQFRVVQTYDNGDTDRWIADMPVEGGEPEMPGPVLDLVVGAAGTVPDATTTAIGSDRSERTPPEDEDNGDGDSMGADLVVLFAAIVVILAAFGYFISTRRGADD
ncbi:MAG: DUF1775 domain-containing protein [Actinomycetota bacterium]